MTFMGFVYTAFKKLQKKADQDLLENQVSHLNTHLLKDIGLYKDGSRIRSLNEQHNTHQAEAQPKRAGDIPAHMRLQVHRR